MYEKKRFPLTSNETCDIFCGVIIQLLNNNVIVVWITWWSEIACSYEVLNREET